MDTEGLAVTIEVYAGYCRRESYLSLAATGTNQKTPASVGLLTGAVRVEGVRQAGVETVLVSPPGPAVIELS
jgi:hypothetical protein